MLERRFLARSFPYDLSNLIARALDVECSSICANRQRSMDNPMTRLFLDCEWADEVSRQLVSLALISQDGQHSFYAERDPLPGAPSAFVLEVVYPLLERDTAALPDQEFTERLRTFLTQFNDPIVLADDCLDFSMLSHALDGFGRSGLPPAPHYRSILITFGDVLVGVEDYFEAHPTAKEQRHHALVDAEALRCAFAAALAEPRS